MATMTTAPDPPSSQPQPWAAGFALLGAPAAWALQLLLGYGLVGHACFPTTLPLETPIWSTLRPLIAAISIAAFVACLAASGVAFAHWRVAQPERSGAAGHLLEVEEGRGRFVALWAVWTSVMFLVAVAFTSINLLLVPLCYG